MNKFSLKCRETGRSFKYFYAENVNTKAKINQKTLETKHPACKWGSGSCSSDFETLTCCN